MTPTLPPKPKSTEPEELTIPRFDLTALRVRGYSELQIARENAKQLEVKVIAELQENRREVVRRHADELKEVDDLLREVAGEKPFRPRRPSMPREELEKAILAVLKLGEASGNGIAGTVGVDPNRVTAALEDMQKRKLVTHRGKSKRASRFSLPE